MVIFHSYVKLPEGTPGFTIEQPCIMLLDDTGESDGPRTGTIGPV